MKKSIKFLLLFAGLLAGLVFTTAQNITLHLRANSSCYLDDYTPNLNQGTAAEMDAIAWTAGGTPFISRCVFNFDISAIPANSNVVSAYLSLWGDTNTGNTEGDDPLSGSNAWFIQRVTSAWGQYTVNWSTQPTTTVTNEVSMPQSTSIYQIYNGINVTSLYQDIVNNLPNNYGLLIRLQTEVKYRAMVFCSSQYPDSNEVPLLVITYKNPAGVNEVNDSHNVQVYPNPTADNLTVSYSTKNNVEVYYSIYDLMGKEITPTTLLGKGNQVTNTVSTNNLPVGMYFIRLTDGNNSTNYKFIKE